MKSQIAKHWSGKNYNSPLKQDKIPEILKPKKKEKPSFISERVIETGPRNAEEEIKKGRASVNKLRAETVGPSGTDIDITMDQHNKLKKRQDAQRREENMGY